MRALLQLKNELGEGVAPSPRIPVKVTEKTGAARVQRKPRQRAVVEASSATRPLIEKENGIQTSKTCEDRRIRSITSGGTAPLEAQTHRTKLSEGRMRGACDKCVASRTEIDAKHLPLLARCLTGPVMRDIYRTGKSAYMAAAFRKARIDELLGRDATLLVAAQAIFGLLSRRYRADYVYRAAVANKLFLGRHSPATTALLSELRVWRSRADLVMLNGTSTVYEIKTELDNFDRLASQLSAYSRMFDRIYVVTHASQLHQLQASIPEHVGVIVLSESFTLQVAREASTNADNTHVPTILDALRRDELVEMTRILCGSVPQVGSVRLVESCSQALAGYPPRRVHDEMVTILKKRRIFTRDDFRSVPRELVPAYLESGVPAREWECLTGRLVNTKIEEVISL